MKQFLPFRCGLLLLLLTSATLLHGAASNPLRYSSPPTITTQPSLPSFCPKDTVSFTVAGTNIDTYQWQISDDLGASYTNLSDNRLFSGTQSSVLTVYSIAQMKHMVLRALAMNTTDTAMSDTVYLLFDESCFASSTQEVWQIVQPPTNSVIDETGFAVDGNRMAFKYGGETDVYIYQYDGTEWVEYDTLSQVGAIAPTHFGTQIALNAPFAFVLDTSAQAVLVYEDLGTGYVLQQTLTGSDSPTWFGTAMVSQGDHLLINGKYVFALENGQWAQKTILSAPTSISRNHGRSALYGTQIAVGGDEAVYIFTGSGSTWTLVDTLSNPNTTIPGSFVGLVDLDSTQLMATFIASDFPQNDQRIVYTFEWQSGGYVHTGTIEASGEVLTHTFGALVQIDGDRALVFSPSDYAYPEEYNGAAFNGRAYYFTRSGGNWSSAETLEITDNQSCFGCRKIALTEDRFYIAGSDRAVKEFGPSPAPKPTTQPTMPEACASNGFSLSAAGNNVDSYQWQVSTDGGSSWSDITDTIQYSGITASTLVVLSDASMAGNQLRCILTNTNGSLATDAVTVAFSGDCEVVEIASWQSVAARVHPDTASSLYYFDATDDYMITADASEQELLIYSKDLTSGTWDLHQVLDGPAGIDFFGSDITIEGNYCFVGVGLGSNKGAVLVYNLSETTWSYLETINAPNNEDYFSESIKADDDYILVSGRFIYQLQSNSWIYQTTLPHTTATNSTAGRTGTIHSGTIAAQGLDGSGTRVVYIYEGSGSSWTQSQVITAPADIRTDEFAWSLSMDSLTLLVGTIASGFFDPQPVLVYEKAGSTWEQSDRLYPNDPTVIGSSFGNRVEILGDRAVVAAPTNRDSALSTFASGYFYFFSRQNGVWSASKAISPDTSWIDDVWFYLGQDMALTDTRIYGMESSDNLFEWGPSPAPKAITHPTMPEACAGESISLSFTGADVTHYQWQRSTDGGTSWVTLSDDGYFGGTQTASLSILTDPVMEGDLYRCLISNEHGTLSTETVTLTFGTACGVVGNDDLELSNPIAGGNFGSAIALQGSQAIVGAPNTTVNGYTSGAAYTFTLTESGWVEGDAFADSSATQAIGYGTAVALDGDYALVGAPKATVSSTSEAGVTAVLYFDGSTWTEQALLSNPSSQASGHFGQAVAIQGDYAFVGAPGNLQSGSANGAVYVYERNGTTWSLIQTLQPDDLSSNADFGYSIAIQGNLVAVGAPTPSSDGAVYLFEKAGALAAWNLDTKMNAPAASGIGFGTSVGLDTDQLVVGASNYSSGQGIAYVYAPIFGEWNLQSSLEAPDGNNNDAFGTSVATEGNYIAVGAQAAETGSPNNHGATYLYYFDGFSWRHAETVYPDNLEEDALGGTAVVLDNLTLLMGVPGATQQGQVDAGKVESFGLPNAPTLTANPVVIVENALAGHWDLEDCNLGYVTDEKNPSQEGTLENGTRLTVGYEGQGLIFDGTNDHVELNDSTWAPGTGGTFSYSLWVNTPDTTSNFQTVLFRETAGFGPIIQIHQGKPQIFLGGLTNPGPYSATQKLHRNTWYHLVFAYNGEDLEVYVNGQLDGTFTQPSGMVNFGSGNHWLGNRSDNPTTYQYTGQLDEVRFFSTALTADMALAEYERLTYTPVVCTPTPISSWSFDSCAANTVAIDNQGAHNGNLVGATRAAGYSGAGVAFDGSNDYVNMGNSGSLEVTNSFTAATWVYPTANSNYQTVMVKNKLGSIYAWFLQLHQGKPTVYLGGTIKKSYIAANAIPLNTWSHVAISFAENTLRLYVDGVLMHTWANISGTLTANAGTELWLGARADLPSQYLFEGRLDEVHLYNAYVDEYSIADLAGITNASDSCSGGARPVADMDWTESNSRVVLYPNPNEGMFTIRVPEGHIQSLQVLNSVGQVVFVAQPSASSQELAVELQTLSPGVYLVQTTTQTTKWIERMVIE